MPTTAAGSNVRRRQSTEGDHPYLRESPANRRGPSRPAALKQKVKQGWSLISAMHLTSLISEPTFEPLSRTL
jgi:hypothetical protein